MGKKVEMRGWHLFGEAIALFPRSAAAWTRCLGRCRKRTSTVEAFRAGQRSKFDLRMQSPWTGRSEI